MSLSRSRTGRRQIAIPMTTKPRECRWVRRYAARLGLLFFLVGHQFAIAEDTKVPVRPVQSISLNSTPAPIRSSADGKGIIVVVGTEAILYDRSLAKVSRLHSSEALIAEIAVAKEKDVIAYGESDLEHAGRITVKRMSGKEPARSFDLGNQEQIGSLALSPDGTRLIAAIRNRSPERFTARCWDLRTGRETELPEDVVTGVSAVCLSADGKEAFFGYEDGGITRVSLSDFKAAQHCQAHEALVRRIDVSPDSRTVVSIGSDASVQLRNFKTLEREHSYELSQRPASICISPDSEKIAVARLDGRVDIISRSEAKCIGHIDGAHDRYVWAVQFFGDGKKFLATGGGNDNCLRLWAIADMLEKK